ncbi:MAG: DUF3667 domain-containing protein [Pseudomonadota bacterium]
MPGGIEAAADAATGAMLARAVEPAAGEGGLAPVAGLCLNCGTALRGGFCHACGQNAHVHRTLGSILHDLLHGVFHFEGKIWRTLPMLVLHPGALTRRYIAGERARFVSPLALFLFTVFLLFATFGALASGDLTRSLQKGVGVADAGFERTQRENAAALAQLQSERARIVRSRGDTRAVDARLASTREDIVTFARLRAKVEGKRGEQVTGVPWFDRGIVKLRTNPALVLYKVQSSAYKYSWALILLSTPLVALLFLWRRGFTLYDHAIFVIYSISFMSLLMITLEVLAAVGLGGAVAIITMVAVPAHMFVQLRGAYSLSRWSAAWRTAALLLIAVTVLLLFVLAVIALGLSD